MSGPTLITLGNLSIDEALLALPLDQQPTYIPGTLTPLYCICGALYVGQAIGDTFAPVTHNDSLAHLALVVAGQVNYNITNADGSVTTTVLNPGTGIVIPLGTTYTFVATTAPCAVWTAVENPLDLTAIKANLTTLSSSLATLTSSVAAALAAVTTSSAN